MSLTHVKDNVWIGSQAEAIEWFGMDYDGKSKVAVLSVMNKSDYRPIHKNYPNVISKFVEMSDWEADTFKKNVSSIVKFIDDNKNAERVIVHCYAGMNRSASSVIAWLMMKKNMSFIKALSYLEAIHPRTQPWEELKSVLKTL